MNDRIKSFLWWKKFPELHPTTYSRFEGQWEICPLCDGVEELDTEIGVIDCLCASKRWTEEIKKTLDPLRSGADPADFNMEPVAIAGDQLENAIVMSQDWASKPEGVFVLSGRFGVGKSHLLRAINTELHPIALYLTASDFEWNCFRAMESSKLHIYVDTVARCPVLLFDDYGMEYGAEFVHSQITHIIDVRVRQIDHYPIAVATNKSGKTLSLEGRVGSRLMNVSGKHTYAKMSGLTDFRTRGVSQ